MLATFLFIIVTLSECITQPPPFGAGDRVNFAGDATIALNGRVVARTQPFQLTEVDVIIAAIDLEDIRVYRHMIRSRCQVAAAQTTSYPRVQVSW